MSGKIIKSGKKLVARKSDLNTIAKKISVTATQMLASNHNENMAMKTSAKKKVELTAPIRKTSVPSPKKLSSNHNETLMVH